MSDITTILISALTELTEVPANDDEMVLNDASASAATKRIDAEYVRSDDVDAIIASGSLAINAKQFITLNLGTAIALTITNAPKAGWEIEIYRLGSGGVTHTVQLPSGVTWDGTNRTANFNGDADRIRAKAISATRFLVLENDSVTFTA